MRRFAIPALVAAAALTAGCGFRAESPSSVRDAITPRQLVVASADATRRVGTARMSMTMRMEVPGEGVIAVQGRGDLDLQRRLLHVSVAFPDSAAALPRFEEIVDGTTLYMRTPTLLQGARWLRIDLRKVGGRAGADLGALMQARQSDPTQMLDYLRGSSRSITRIGRDDVRGVAATHYRVDVDLDRIPAEMPAAARRPLRQAVARVKAITGVSVLPVDVWIDAHGLVRREAFELRFDGALAGAMAGASMQMSMDLYDFGAPVKIRVPDASRTVDYSDLLAARA